MARYIPKKGDFIALDFNPQSGHEQKGRRPALVISNTNFNKKTGLAVVCPLTNTDRGIPFHLPVVGTARVTGYVMTEQLKSLDFAARHAKKIAVAAPDLLSDVIAIVHAYVEQPPAV